MPKTSKKKRPHRGVTSKPSLYARLHEVQGIVLMGEPHTPKNRLRISKALEAAMMAVVYAHRLASQMAQVNLTPVSARALLRQLKRKL